MKKMFLVALSMLLMCMMVCTPYAAEAVQEITKYDTASLRDFPDLVNDGTIEEHKLLERRHDDEKEAMNMLAYRKESGENVAFLYHFDVKYKDKNGNIKDKSKEIVRDGLFSTTSFKTKDNDILSYFSVNDDGNVEVKTVYGEYSIVSVIENRNKGNRITAERDTEDTLTYRNAVDTGIHLMYEAEYNGVKEYIVLDANSGNKFTFTMDFVGLTPQLAADNSVLLLNADGETVLTIPPIYVEDSAVEKNSTYDNTVKLTQISKKSYSFEITVDTGFLTNIETIFPVFIDPHITVPNNNIIDTYVSESSPVSANNSSSVNYVGYNEDGKRYYTYIMFNNLDSLLPRCSYHNILSAYYQTYETSKTSDTVLIDVLPVSATWSQYICWNDKPGYHNEIMVKAQVGNNDAAKEPYDYGEYGLYRFYISNMVRGWAQGLPNYGIVLKTRYNTGKISLASSSNTTYSSNIKLVIVYVNDSDYPVEGSLSVPSINYGFYIKNKRSGLYLSVESTTTASNVYQSDFTGSANQQWILSSIGDDYYQIRLRSSALSLEVNNSTNTNGTDIRINSYNGSANQQWKFTRNWNGTYQILSKLSNDTKGIVIYNASNADGANCILYTHNVNFTYNDDWTLEPIRLTKALLYSFTNTDNSNGILNTVSDMEYAKEKAVAMGFTSSVNNQDSSASAALQGMANSTLWYFRGHGINSCFSFPTYDSSNGMWIKTYLSAAGNAANGNYVANLSSNKLRNLFLMGSNCCLAGNSGDFGSTEDALDLVGMVYRKGAHFAFATPPISHTSQNSSWCRSFMDALYSGKSYYDAMQYADEHVLIENDYSREAMISCGRHYAGDSSIILYHNPSAS